MNFPVEQRLSVEALTNNVIILLCNGTREYAISGLLRIAGAKHLEHSFRLSQQSKRVVSVLRLGTLDWRNDCAHLHVTLYMSELQLSTKCMIGGPDKRALRDHNQCPHDLPGQ
jgi:hypothetical protein